MSDDVDGGRDDFAEYREVDATITSNARDGFTVDVNGTQVFFKQHNPHVPTILEIWIADEERPTAAIDVARGKTVTLGGIDEDISDDLRQAARLLADVERRVRWLSYRSNPTGTTKPEDKSSDREASS